MKVKEDTYVNIQAFMVNDLKLSGNELIIYACIYGFSQDGESWFTGSRSFLAGWCQASKSTVSRNLEKLCKAGLVDKRVRMEKGLTLVDYRAVHPAVKEVGGTQNGSGGVPKMGAGGVPKMSPHNIEVDNPIRNHSDIRQVRYKHGEYANVLLSTEDLDKLRAEFPHDWKERIERLSAYMASTGKSYKNHLATIRNWARRDQAKEKPKQAYNPQDTEEWPEF